MLSCPALKKMKFVLLGTRFHIWVLGFIFGLCSCSCVFVCTNYLRSSGGVRICPSQSASNVKIRPRHITTRWEGQGPSRSVTQQKRTMTQQKYVSWRNVLFKYVHAGVLKVKDNSHVYSTCLEVVADGVLLHSGHFAGAEQHSELIHI